MGDQNFWQLCYNGDIEGVQAAIDNGADVNEENDLGETGLMWALLYSHNNVVQVLLLHPQINVNKVHYRGRSALHHAVWNDNHEGLAALLDRNDLTTINQRNVDDQAPIMKAVVRNAVNCFQLLLTNPLLDLDTRDNYERTTQEVRR